MTSIHTEVRQFVVDNFLFGQTDKPLDNDQSFLEGGIIDSTGVLELIAFLESRYGISIGDDELLPANLDSISRIAAFVGRKLEEKAPAGAN
jgi:acyl carrier protein